MASTKAMKVLAYVMLALTFLATLQTAEAYHEHFTMILSITLEDITLVNPIIPIINIM